MRLKNQRFSSEELFLIRKLTDDGKSLAHLSQLLCVGKPTIYYQVRKFKPRIKKDFIVNLEEFQIGELIGAFAGDGSYVCCLNDKKDMNRGRQHRIRYHISLRDEYPYAEYLASMLKQINLNPHLFNSEKRGVVDVQVSSVEFISFIKEYLIWERDKTLTVRLRRNILEYSDIFLRGFARGLMDTDGFLNTSNASCACISLELINNLSDIFKKFNLEITRTVSIRGGNTRPLHFVRVRRKSLDDFNKFIGFSNSHKKMRLNQILAKG